ncbi:MAG: betB 1 [Gemmataceae bacterium]|nr:betB 1 [Gemmataceae bacterium]
MSPPPFAAEIASCRAAQQVWDQLPVRERLRLVRELRHLLVDRTDDILAAVAADIGRPPVEVVGTEVLPTAAALKFLEQEAARLLKPRKVPGRLKPTWLFFCRDAVYRRPWGVVAVIGTWNYPLYLNVVQLAQALVAGNGVLWKPSENAPLTADLTHRLFRDAGFPSDLLVKLPAGRDVGAQLAEAEVDHVVFTGSDTVGRKLAARLGERLIPSTLELSGCDAMFVLEDANVELAARAAWFGLVLNRGQTCIAVRRVFVHRSKAAAFAAALRPLAGGGEPVSLVTPGQVEQADRSVREAVSRGASVLGRTPSPGPSSEKGGEEDPSPARPSLSEATSPPAPPLRREGSKPLTPAPPSFPGKGVGGLGSSVFPPTVLLDATPDMLICREASFAPVAAVIPFDTVDEAVALAGKCPFGLAASVFSADVQTGEALASRIATGAVVVNDVVAPTAHPATPFGGRGASGWGVTQGAEGLLAMTVPQTVTVHRGTFRPHVDEVVSPDPAATLDVLRGLLRATHGRGLGAWFGGVRQLIRGIRKKKR